MPYCVCDFCKVKVSNQKVKLFQKNESNGKEYRGFFCPFCNRSMRRAYGGESDE